MVKLVDTLVSGTSGLTAVQVRVLFWALIVDLTTCKYSFAGGYLFYDYRQPVFLKLIAICITILI